MEKKKIHYGWYIVIGCLLITCTMVPPIMALSNKFLIQVTEELGIKCHDWNLLLSYACKYNPSGTGNLYFPYGFFQTCKRRYA